MRLCSSSAASYSACSSTSRWVRAGAGVTSFIGRPVSGCGACRACLCRTNPRAAPYPEIGAPSGRGVLARLAERDVGPAFQGELEIHARGREAYQCAAVIERQVIVHPAAELLQLARIRALDPARGVDGDGLENALHAGL